MTLNYEFWDAALSGQEVALDPDSPPQPGYYLHKTPQGSYIPVAIWCEDDELLVKVGDELVDDHSCWPFCARYPISETNYEMKMKHYDPTPLEEKPPAI